MALGGYSLQTRSWARAGSWRCRRLPAMHISRIHFTYQEASTDAFAVDTNDNLYSFWANGGICAIATQTFSNAAISFYIYSKFAGSRNCGFSGDGGQANSAEIGKVVSQIAFDLAGNVYFS